MDKTIFSKTISPFQSDKTIYQIIILLGKKNKVVSCDAKSGKKCYYF